MLANDLRIGNVIIYKDSLWAITETAHIKPGKGGAFIQTTMKELKEGTKTNVRFRSDEKVEKAFLDEAEYSYLYVQGDDVYLMNDNTYEQIVVNKDIFNEQFLLLQEGVKISVRSHEKDIVSADIVGNVIMKVQECETVVKGQTATSSYKPSYIASENSDKMLKIMVPQFINSGDIIVINPATMEYVKKHKG